jgi:hypothetical protein
MSASNVLADVRKDDDIYENDKYLSYSKSSISFKRWCELILLVYPEHGMMCIAYVIMTVFRDVLFKRNRNFPLLYFFGGVGSGKSKIAESVCCFFTRMMPLYNLGNGTDFAFFSYVMRFVNVAVGLNEFDENKIRDNWFDAIKGAFDGEGRAKGAGLKNKTITQKINAAIILIGQFLTTKDDNSVLSRTIPCKITENKNRTDEQNAYYDELVEYETAGISSLICEVLPLRDFIIDHYNKRFVTVNAELKQSFKNSEIQPKVRTLENYSAPLTMVSLFCERMNLGFNYDTFFTHCKSEIVKVSSVMSESNSLGQFWKTVEFLLDQNMIECGFHYRIEVKSDVRVLVDRKAETKKFEEPKKMLFLRIGTVHSLYMSEIRRQTGKSGQNEQSILSYMKDQPSYIGNNPGSWFSTAKGEKINTSSYVFDYYMLGANLERFKDDNLATITLQGKLMYDAIIENIIDTEKLVFSLVQDESYTNDAGDPVKKQLVTKCISTELTQSHLLKRGREIKVTGSLNIRPTDTTTYRSMKVTAIEIVEAQLPFTPSDEAAEAAFGKGDAA